VNATHHYTFDVIRARREVSGKCIQCGKRVKRVLTSEQTHNPFNKHPDGRVKSRGEIQRECEADVSAQAAKWKPVCRACEDAARAELAKAKA
jgi:hypothetical protein